MSKMNALGPFIAILTLAFLPSSSLAGNDDAKDRAKVLFEEGVRLFGEGHYEVAANKFEEANRTFPSWKILYNIGQCEVLLKNYGLALEAFENYLVSGGDDVTQDRQEEVRKEIARLRDMCGDVQVAGVHGAIILIDGKERGRTPTQGGIAVGSGIHELKIAQDDVVLLLQEIRIRGKKTLTVEVKGKAVPAPAPVPVATVDDGQEEPVGPAPPEDDGSNDAAEADEPFPTQPANEEGPRNKKMILGGVLVAAGGVALIAGIVTGGVSRSKTRELEDRCPDKQCPDEGDRTLHDQAASLSVATDVLIPVGAVLAATGTVLVLLGLKSERDEENGPVVTAAVGPGELGLIFEGRF